MVVCRFFQQGNCRFGQNCRNEHIYGSKYTYHANPTQQSVTASTQPPSLTDQQLVLQVQGDVQSALLGGQWLLSCYSPFKEGPIYPGIHDLSPEEARLFIYEAKSNNNLEQAVTYMNNLMKETKEKYEQLLQPNMNIIKILRSLYNGETPTVTNTAQSVFAGANNAATSIFRTAVQNSQPAAQSNTAASIFNQGQKSIFGTQTDPAKELFSRANNTNIFGQSPPANTFGTTAQNSTAKSFFASAVQNTANQFPSANQANPSGLFSSANQSIFGSQPSQSSPFAQTQSNTPFSQSNNSSPFAQNQNTSPFAQGHQKSESPASIFGLANQNYDVADNTGIYSKIEELSQDELEAFKSDKFELGFVPELPPPFQLCART